MTDLLEHAIARLREQSPEEQDRKAVAILDMLDEDEADHLLTPEQIESVRQTLADLDSGRTRLLSEAETEAMWHRLGA